MKTGIIIAAFFGLIAAASVITTAHADDYKPKKWEIYRVENGTGNLSSIGSEDEEDAAKLINAATACQYVLDKNQPNKDDENREYEACINKHYK